MKILNGIFQFVAKRKIVTAVIIAVLIIVGYFLVKSMTGKSEPTRYVIATVEKGTIITSVSGSGQVSSENELDIKSKVSGTVIGISAKKGKEVKAGDVIAKIDANDAYKTLRDAQVNLETAQLSLNKLKESVTALELLQAENDLTRAKATLEQLKQTQPLDIEKAKVAKENAIDNLEKGYDDAFSNISDAFIDLPTIITALEDVLYSNDLSNAEYFFSKGQDNKSSLINSISSAKDKSEFEILQNGTIDDYNNARTKYSVNFENYKKITRYSNNEEIAAVLSETLETVRAMSQAAKSEKNYIDTWVDIRSASDQSIFQAVRDYQSDLAGYIGQIDNHLSKLTSSQTTLRDNEQALTDAIRNLDNYDYNNPYDLQSAELTVKEKEAYLEELKDGPDVLELRAAELTLQQRQNDLVDAQEILSDYIVRAPFDGLIASIDIDVNDDVTAGSAIATLITKQFMAEISLNEVDVAKVKVDQKVTLTFDAISDLSISGRVADVDIIGTVSQGVVTYNVKIVFDTQDERVKSGMSVSAAIITDIKQDVLMVPNAAIKTAGGVNYVEIPDEEVEVTTDNSGVILKKTPKQQIVQVGLANDSYTEITEGLAVGAQIITRTINSSTNARSTTTQSSSNRSLFMMGGGAPGR
ncbi:MAG: HlyD family efflux transporter periplasmic adaptor subunit [Candidatus Parcubacteria bacterium]|nr:HlyD family efflux transporter periplasmic adaptor subunit [Candidatus Parcubacteria bacterium]